jgi:glycosyltransferase involved in cell wall biosynthesis
VSAAHISLAPVEAIAFGRWVQVVTHLDPKYGGLSAAVPALSERIARAGTIDVSLAAFCAPGEEVCPQGINAEDLSFWPAGRKAWMNAVSLREDFERVLLSATGVHIHGLWEKSTAVAAESARKLGVPYVLSAHGMLEPWALANKRLKKMLYAMMVERKNVQRAMCLHALTRAEADHFIHFGARSPIAVIPNGVDIPKARSPKLFLEGFPEAQGRRVVLFLARLHPKKGLGLLVDAWRAVQNEWPDAMLFVAGPDFEDMRERLERQVREQGLAESVLFTGMLEGAMKWSAMAAAECFVLPSYSEGLSVSVLEAMGMGVPVIVTEPCNMSEVTEAKAGWEIKVSVEELKGALRLALGNSPAENVEIGARGAELVATRYAWKTVARQMEDVYLWVQGGSTPKNVDVVYP